jgi:hypothetical protein
MTDIDKARTQRDALTSVAGRRTAGPSRAAHAIEQFLGAALYEARKGQHENAVDEQNTNEPSNAPPTAHEPPDRQTS